jgi:signal peptidase I
MPAAPAKHRRAPGFWRELPILMGVSIVVAILVRTFVLQTFWVPSPSMTHTLNRNDRVLVNKLAYDFGSPHRGDVIVFTSPVSWRQQPDEKVFVKRVIGVPGDRIVCCDPQGRLTVNGTPINEPYLNHDQPHTQAAPEQFQIVVPAGRLWVMGDNRYDSADSLYNYEATDHNMTASTIPISSGIGRAFVLFWPVKRATWLTLPAWAG